LNSRFTCDLAVSGNLFHGTRRKSTALPVSKQIGLETENKNEWKLYIIIIGIHWHPYLFREKYSKIL